MVLFSKPLFTYSFLLVLLNSPTFAKEKECSINRENDSCKSKTLQEEYKCLMKQNSLLTIMDCVEGSIQDNGREKMLCHSFDDNNPNTEDDEIFTFQYSPKSKQWCTTPRNILIQGPKTHPKGKLLSMRGALEACPETDPDFRMCLCMHNIKEDAMKQMANLFMPASAQDWACPKLRKRDTSFLDAFIETPHLHAAQEKKGLQVCVLNLLALRLLIHIDSRN
jgi:hypothetical protein